jgi:tetratricopeptide (TPR) repeat protein
MAKLRTRPATKVARRGTRSKSHATTLAARSAAPAIAVRTPVAPPPPPGPPAEAMSLFQRGMEAVQRHAFGEASTAFQALLGGFPTERALGDRARVYLELCEREAKKRPSSPRTIEERLTAATAALNNGDNAQAEELARNVLGDDPKHDLALYLLAALHARRGDLDEALALLTKVMAISPEASAQARHDEDFEPLHDSEAFWKLLEPPAVPASDARRPRKGRAER